MALNLKSDDDKLLKIYDLNAFTERGMCKCDLYNQDGALLLKKGTSVLSTLGKMSVYVYKKNYIEIMGFDPDARQVLMYDGGSDGVKPENIEAMDRAEIIKVLDAEYGKKTSDYTIQAISTVKDILSRPMMTKQSYDLAKNVVEESFNMDKAALSGCLNALRDVDDYTYNHSFGVFLIFSQALEDFKKHTSNPAFYDVFKVVNSNVNFNPASLKKYATAALLHDFGKISIPKEIINKKGVLTESEFEIIKYHPKIAVKTFFDMGIEDMDFLEIVGNHHQRYPVFPKRGQGALAQICNMIDIYEACRSRRIYKSKNSLEETQLVLQDEAKANGWNSFLFAIIMKETLPKFESKRIM